MLLVLLLLAAWGHTANAAGPNMSTWHVVWTGGQSNSVGTNSQKSGTYPTWQTTERIQMFCAIKDGGGCTDANGAQPAAPGFEYTFTAARVPMWGERNVAFSQTFANLLLATLPADHGVIVVNTGVGGTGFIDKMWNVPSTNATYPKDGVLAANSVNAMVKLHAVQPVALPGNYVFHAMLWHQGEDDAGDNCWPDKFPCRQKPVQHFKSTYCNYLQNDMGKLIDYFRSRFPGASAGTPFIDGGLLPYWVDAASACNESVFCNNSGSKPVMDAIYALNTSRACTGTADSRIFSDFQADGKTPNGDPDCRSGITGDVIHFNATQAVMMGHQYWAAYQRALMVTTPVASARTAACNTGGNAVASVVTCTT